MVGNGMKIENLNLRLHLGCGGLRLDGFTNVDIYPSSATDVIADIRKLNFPDKSADLIYSSHVLEHFPHGEVISILKEWQRILSTGGRLVCVVPNFDIVVDHYAFSTRLTILETVWNIFLKKVFKRQPEYRKRSLSDHLIADITGGALFPKIDYVFENYHKCIFTPASFEKLALQAGFTQITPINLVQNDPISGVKSSTLHWTSMAFELRC